MVAGGAQAIMAKANSKARPQLVAVFRGKGKHMVGLLEQVSPESIENDRFRTLDAKNMKTLLHLSGW
jgi:hypothetical protein